LFAFYSRREANRLEKASRNNSKPPEMERMLKIITERGQFRGYVANDFGEEITAPRFFADAMKKRS
jgi:hypothetical protein